MRAKVQDRLAEDRVSGMGAAALFAPAQTGDGPVTVGVASDADARAWTAYVDAQPEGTVYHCWPWRRVLAEAFAHLPHYLVARRGERIVVCGPSGSGKSTLIRCINALEDFQEGRIVVDGIALGPSLRHVDQVRR